MTWKIRQILVLAVTLSATPTWQARETIRTSNGQMQARNHYDQFNNWVPTTQYPPTPYATAIPSVWSTTRQRASSILTPTEYCDMDFQEMSKISLQDSICNPQVLGYKKNETQ